MKKCSILIILFLYVTSTIYTQVINDDNVRMRDVPFLTSNIVTKVNKGDKVTVFRQTDFSEAIDGKMDRWYFVKFNTHFGWIFGKYISGIANSDKIYVSKYSSDITTLLSKEKVNQANVCYFDYDFKRGEFVKIFKDGKMETVDIKMQNRMRFNIHNEVVVWFDPVDIRNNNGTAVYSDLIIKNKNAKEIIYPEKYNLEWYWGEIGYLHITDNNKYLIIDKGTWHIRGIDIFDLTEMKCVFHGATTDKTLYYSGSSIEFISNSKSITGYQQALEYCKQQNIRYDIHGNEVKDIITSSENADEYISFYFGTKCLFDTEQGIITYDVPVLFYISKE